MPNVITTCGLFSGFYAIVQAMNMRFDLAAIAIFVALTFDVLDGRVARITRTESDFGAEYDSLSDMVAFGAAPALIIYEWGLRGMDKFGWFAAFVYCGCAALRLARFNTAHPDLLRYVSESTDCKKDHLPLRFPSRKVLLFLQACYYANHTPPRKVLRGIC